jgi:8-oxo-dGTP pyrophosphatase MutT (NUDIX family)
MLAGADQRRADPLREDRPEDVRSRLGRHTVVPAAHLLLVDERGRLLMLRRAGGWAAGLWSVPAGHLDGREPVTTAMAREAREEVGVGLDPDDLRMVHVMHRAADGGGGERIDFFLRCWRWTGAPTNREPAKCAELDWFDLDDLPADTVPYVRAAVEAVDRDEPYSEHGW